MCRYIKCLCKSCMKICGKCCECKKSTEFCNNYIRFTQMSIFDLENDNQSVKRKSLEHYGISKQRYMQLKDYIQSGRYDSIASQAAHTANKDIAEYLILSVTQNKSYDALRVKWELKEMERIPYCRTDFYGIRRYFYSLFDKELRRIGK